MTSYIIQLVRRQIFLTTKEVVQINLKPPIHFNKTQIMLSTSNLNTAFFNTISLRVLVPIRTNLVYISRQFQKLLHALILFCTSEKELVIKTKYVVSDDNIRIFTLDQLLPGQQDLLFCGIRLYFSIFKWKFTTSVQYNTVIHVRIFITIF